jgi:chromosome segregation ATPase
MTDDQRNAKQGSGVGEESAKELSKIAKKRERDKQKNKLSQIRERKEPASPSEGRTKEESEQGSVAETEYEQDDGASSQAMSERGVIEEDGPEQDTTRPQYANPTKASKAKRNEKIELPFTMKKTLTLKEPPTSRPGTALRQQRSVSVLGSRRPSLLRMGSAIEFGKKQDDAASERSAASSVTSRKGKGHRRDMRSRSLTAADIAYANQDGPFLSTIPNIPITISSAPAPGTTTYEDEPFTIERWRQEDDEREAVPLGQKDRPETPNLEEPLAPLMRQKHKSEPELMAQSREQQLEYMDTSVSKPEKQIESETQDSRVEDKGKNDDIVLGKVVSERDALKDQLKAADVDNEALKTQLKAAEKQRDESEDHLSRTQVELQTCIDRGENLKWKHDKLQKQIAALEDREPILQSSAAAAAENKRHRVVIQDLERKIAETSAEIKTKEEDEKNLKECIDQIQDELNEVNKTLEELKTYNDTLSRIVDEITQSESIDFVQLDKVISSLPTNSNASDLHTKVSTLIQHFAESKRILVNTQQDQQRQIADKEDKIDELKKGMAAWEQEHNSFSSPLSSGLPSPGLLSPLSPNQADRDSFEKLFNDERRKRKAAEEKLAEVEANAKKTHSSQLQEQNAKHQTELTSAQEELTTLRKKADELEKLSKQWQGEVEDTKEELLKRTDNFTKTIAQQQREVYTHVQEYHKKTQDSAHWEVQGLQKKLAAVEADLADTKKRFDQIKSDSEHREHHIKGLEQDQRVRIAHLGNVEQAHYRGEKLPSLPPVKSEANDVARSPTSSSSTPWPPNPHSITTPVIPACLLPAAMDRRKADLEKYSEDLKLAREKEVLEFVVKAPPPDKFAHDDIIEKLKKWKLGNLYPPEKQGWDAYKAKSAWERWQGAKWMELSTISRRDEQALRKRGLWTAV